MLQVQLGVLQVGIGSGNLRLRGDFLGFRHLPLRLDRFQIGLRGLHLRLRRVEARHSLVIDRLRTIASVLGADTGLKHFVLKVLFPFGVIHL